MIGGCMSIGIMLLIIFLFGICGMMTVAALFFKDKPEDIPVSPEKKEDNPKI